MYSGWHHVQDCFQTIQTQQYSVEQKLQRYFFTQYFIQMSSSVIADNFYRSSVIKIVILKEMKKN